jgi:hypothetical protein
MESINPEINCQLKVEPFKQCCCKCIYHLPVHHHCTTEPKPTKKVKGRCVCGVQKGWACVAPEFGRVYDNWPKHSVGCECYTTKEQKAKDDKRVNTAISLLFRHEYPKAPFNRGDLELLKLKSWPFWKKSKSL